MSNSTDFVIRIRNGNTNDLKLEAWKQHRIKVLHNSLTIILDLRNTSQTDEDFERYTRNYNNIIDELKRLTSRP